MKEKIPFLGELISSSTLALIAAFLVSVTVAVILVFCQTGCVTTPQGQARVNKAVQIIKYTVPSAVQVALAEESSSRPYLEAAAAVIATAASDMNTTPATLLNKLNEIPGATPMAKLAIMGGVGLYTAFFADQVASDEGTMTVLRAVATSIQEGLDPAASKRIKRSR